MSKRLVSTNPSWASSLSSSFLHTKTFPQSVSSGVSCLHFPCSLELSYSCTYCLSSYNDKVRLCYASLGQQSTQRPPSVAVSIRVYQMLHSPCQPKLLRDELISSSTWCTERWSLHPWRVQPHTHRQNACVGCLGNLKYSSKIKRWTLDETFADWEGWGLGWGLENGAVICIFHYWESLYIITITGFALLSGEWFRC